MSMVLRVPDRLAARLRALAQAGGRSAEDIAIAALDASPLLAAALPNQIEIDETEDPLEAFFGCGDSGDPSWAGTDTRLLRNPVA